VAPGAGLVGAVGHAELALDRAAAVAGGQQRLDVQQVECCRTGADRTPGLAG
jgi:hypothetical protein